MTVSAFGRINRTGGYPAVRCRVISPAGVQDADEKANPTPDDHVSAGPHCCVTVSAIRRVGSAGCRPTIRAGAIPPAGILLAANQATISAPDDHFAASPHCRVRHSAVRSAREIGWSPRIANASDRGIRYYRKGIIAASRSDGLIKHSALLFHSLGFRVREQTLS